ncbi:MAG: hypothetical protein U0599_14505 [Vicinamibacteria bacterium]
MTRVASVRFGNHMSFAVISLAMFGLTAGALATQLAPRAFAGSPERVRRHLSGATALAALALPLAYAYLARTTAAVGSGAWSAGLIALYLASAAPFALAGVSICLVLTRYDRVPWLYAADLAGAGAAGALYVTVTGRLHPSSVVLVLSAGLLLSAGAFARSRAVVGLCAAAALGMSVATVVQEEWRSVLPPLAGDARMSSERWNAYSRVAVFPESTRPFGWGQNASCAAPFRADQRMLMIDRSAGTPLTRFAGDLGAVGFLTCDVTYVASALPAGRRVLVVGLGGGRDVLANLLAGQARVTAVEVNELVIELLEGPLLDFTGRISRHPRVSVVNDEARSFVARSRERYGLVQVSMVDTFAASASGAFALTENGLYTVEAFRSFLAHLEEDGVLSVSRWHYYADPPFETLRTMAIARRALEEAGAREPARHLVVAVGGEWQMLGPRGTSTVLVKKTPFTPEEVARIAEWTRARGLGLAYAPGVATLSQAEALATAPDLDAFVAGQDLDVSPSTDDRPFFFLMGAKPGALERHRSAPIYAGGLRLLHRLLLVTAALTVVVILLPALAASDASVLRRSGHRTGAAYFAAIGLAFMLVEIGLMQRLSLFLGNPTLGLTVALSALLVSSGAGSLWVGGRVGRDPVSRRLVVRIAVALGVVLGAATLVSREAMSTFAGSPTLARVALAVAIVAPAGFVMGTLFPLGMSVAQRIPMSPTAWFWALNGGASVVASVLAMIVAASAGIERLMLLGTATYAAALLLLAGYRRLGERAADQEERTRAPSL